MAPALEKHDGPTDPAQREGREGSGESGSHDRNVRRRAM
jgi:hypothetical protein